MPDDLNKENSAFLRALFSALAETQERYCVLRNWEGLPETCGNDLDLFIDPKHLDRVGERMISVAAEHGYVLCSRTRKFGYCSFDFMEWDRRDHLKIDLFTKIHFQGLCLLENKEVLKDLRAHNHIAVASPSVENFINMTKDMLDSGVIKDKYRAQISESLRSERQGGRLTQLLEHALGPQGRTIILDYRARGETANAAARRDLRRLFRHRHYGRAPFRSLIGQARAALQRWRADRAAARSSRLTIALLGPDGSGKSTVSEMIRENLIAPEQTVQYRHGRPGYTPDLRQIVNFLRRGVGGKPLPANPKGENAVHDHQHRPLLASIYLIYYGIDFWIDQILFRLGRGGHVRVFDRYWYDYFFLPSFARMPRVLKLWQHLLPKADLLLVLKAEPEVIFARKPELTIAQIRDQNARAARIAASRSEAQMIGTDREMSQTIVAIAKEIGAKR